MAESYTYKLIDGKLELTFKYRGDVDKVQATIENAAKNFFSDYEQPDPENPITFDDLGNQAKVTIIGRQIKQVITLAAKSIVQAEEKVEADIRTAERTHDFDE